MWVLSKDCRLDFKVPRPIHGFDPHTTGATAVSWFWGIAHRWLFHRQLLLKIFDSRKVLIGTCIGALLCVTAALFGPADIAVIAFPAIGLLPR